MKGAVRTAVASVLFFLSGALGLVYEIVWVKVLSLQLGSAAWSVATVVAAFMAGLGAGGFVAGRRASGLPRPVRTYGAIELGIAIFGAVSLPLLRNADMPLAPLLAAHASSTPWLLALRLLLVTVLLLVPTVLMGASLPVLVAGLSRGRQFGTTAGLLYGINTFGAAIGVVAAGFWLLPRYGIRHTLWCAIAAGVVVGLVAFLGDRGELGVPEREGAPSSKRPAWGLLGATLVFGFVGIFLEVAWTRLFAPVLGSSTYAFSVTLATFLAGIALGGVAAARASVPAGSHRATLAAVMAGLAAAAILAFRIINVLPEIFVALAEAAHGRLGLFFIGQAVSVALVMALPAFLLGIAFPLTMEAFRLEGGDEGVAVGSVYAANTVGSVLGSLCAGFVLLPAIGTHASVVAVAAAAFVAAALLAASDRSLSDERRVAAPVAIVVVGAILAARPPAVNMAKLHHGFFRHALAAGFDWQGQWGDLVFVKEGYSSTVTVYRTPDDAFLKVNGKTDASLVGDLATQYTLGHLPLFVHPNPKAVCVIGLGSGATVGAVAAHPVDRIDVVELEPAVRQAAAFFSAVNGGALSDPRVHLRFEDGRSYLRFTRKRYDVIISEPSNPWIAGVGSLFSTEFYRQAVKRLNDDGVFCQWIQGYELSDRSLGVMMQTIADAFPHVYVFVQGSDMICLGSLRPLRVDPAVLEQRFERPAVRTMMARLQFRTPVDLLAGYLASFPEDRDRFPARDRNNDDNLWLEYHAPAEMYADVFPQLPVIAPGAQLDRFAHMFFDGKSRREAALALADSIARTRPAADVRIERLAALFTDPATRNRLEADQRAAKEAARRLQGVDERVSASLDLAHYGEDEMAIHILEAVHRNHPEREDVLRILGSLYEKRSPDAARAAYAEAVRLAPWDYIALSELGRLQIAVGIRSGRDRLEEAVRCNPTYVPAWTSLVIDSLLVRDGSAKKMLERAKSSLQPASYGVLLTHLRDAENQLVSRRVR